MPSLPDLAEREGSVLAALVHEYTETGDPVGSKTLAREYGLGVSSATIRATLAELESKGLAYHPHTSAGRVPTDLGIRAYIESLMELQPLTEGQRQQIRGQIDASMAGPERWRSTGRLLSELTEHAALILSPSSDDMVLVQIRFVPLQTGGVLALLVGESGMVHHRAFPLSERLSASRLERVHNYLNELIPGRTLTEARAVVEREMQESRRTLDAMRSQALTLGRDALGGVTYGGSVLVQGEARLVLGRSGGDRARLEELMSLLEDQSALARLLDGALEAEGSWVVIGGEHPVTAGARCSVVAAVYRQGDRARGTLAVLGPRSMDYRTVLPLVEFTASAITGSGEQAA